MSVDFARAYAQGMEFNGVVMHYWPGWESRGNGQSSDYQGHLWHHTGSPYGSAYAALVEGRPDLTGPLCNAAGNADGSVTLVAAHPANHAGASGGYSMGPLPVTRLFNRLVWGLEIVYPGTSPMTLMQYRAACISAAVVSAILRRPNAQWCRGHAETSVTGKWDPGFAPPNRTVDLAQMRADTWLALQGAFDPAEDEDMGTKLFYAKGDLSPAVYLVEVTMDAGQPLTRRHVAGTEWAIAAGSGARLATIGQAAFDAIPKVDGSP